MRTIVDTDPRKHVIALTLSSGLVTSTVVLVASGLAKSLPLPTVLGIAIVLGPAANIVFLYIGSALMRLTGRWLGGRATPQEMRAAWAWSSLPFMFTTVLFAPMRMILDGSPGLRNDLEISSTIFKILWGGYPVLATAAALDRRHYAQMFRRGTSIFGMASVGRVHNLGIGDGCPLACIVVALGGSTADCSLNNLHFSLQSAIITSFGQVAQLVRAPR